MAQLLTDTTKAQALDAITATTMSLHNGDPGADGAANEISGGGYSRQACTWAAASGNSRPLDAAVDFVGPALQAVSWIGLWVSTTFKARLEITTGDLALNASGEYRVTTSTALQISDPA